jgi:metallo-beta-lactamase family protein
MCDAGRIKHHLKHNLWRKESSIVFVGYQAVGTLGRTILDGAKTVKLFGEEVAVNAQIHILHGLSGHADRNGLLEWVEGFKNKPKEIMLVHGDHDAQVSFMELIKSKGYNARIMQLGDKFYLNEGVVRSKEVTAPSLGVKEKILKLLNSIEDVDSMDKDALSKEINKIINA